MHCDSMPYLTIIFSVKQTKTLLFLRISTMKYCASNISITSPYLSAEVSTAEKVALPSCSAVKYFFVRSLASFYNLLLLLSTSLYRSYYCTFFKTFFFYCKKRKIQKESCKFYLYLHDCIQWQFSQLLHS